jgi:hypothetical protein
LRLHHNGRWLASKKGATVSDGAAERRVGFLGLPETGKTTYAVAFFMHADAGRGDVRISSYSHGNREFLNKQASGLKDFKTVERTGLQESQALELRLQFKDDAEEMLFTSPDPSGEALRRDMGRRMMVPRIAEIASDFSSVIVFVRINDLIEASTQEEFRTLLAMAGVEPGQADGSVPQPEDWDLSLGSTQAQLVDVIQEILRLRNGQGLRLALALSAWDRRGGNVTPADWAATHLPLVTQALNGDASTESTTFGISAQGGDFANEEDRKRLAEIALSERADVADAEGKTVDISAPIAWVLQD